MLVINQRGEVINSPWQTLTTLPPALPAGHWLVQSAHWQQLRVQPLAETVQLGVTLDNTETISEFAADLARFALIALHFPRFTDGRAYSQARQLRDVFGYQGELRAYGEVLRDQLWFMAQCGFTSFVLQTPQAVAECQQALSEISAMPQFSSR